MANLQRIKDLAETRKISIRELADRVGVKENQIHVMCRTNSTKIDTLEKIAHELGVPAAYFFDDEITIEKKVFHATGERSLLADHIDKVDMRDQRKVESGTQVPNNTQLDAKPTYEQLEQKVLELQDKLLVAQSKIISLMEGK